MAKQGNSKHGRKKLPTIVQLTAAAGDASGQVKMIEAAEGEGNLPTFEMLAYSGGRMNPMGFFDDVVVDLDGLQIESQAMPILINHQRNGTASIYGHSTRISNDGKQVAIEGVASGVGEEAQNITAISRNGFPWQSSIGAKILKTEFVESGESAKANGRTFEGPVLMVRNAILKETSVVTIGGDSNATTSIAAQLNTHQEPDDMLTDEEREFIEATLGLTVDDLSDDQIKNLQAQFKHQQQLEAAAAEQDKTEKGGGSPEQPGVKPETGVNTLADSLSGEAKRLAAIQAACGTDNELLAEALDNKWTLDQINDKKELKALKSLRDERPQMSHTRQHKDTKPAAIEAAMCMQLNVPVKQLEAAYGEKAIDQATSVELRSMGIQQLMHMVCASQGRYIAPGGMDDARIRTAFEADQLNARDGFSTVSLSGILGNVANKVMLAAFNAVNDPALRFVSQSSVNDFKKRTQYRMTGKGEFQEVGPGGELKHVGLSEESYENQAKTSGAIMTLTREMIINDDLGAFAQIPGHMGRMARLAEIESIYKVLLGNAGGFFSGANNNLLTGATSNLSIESLTAMLQLFRDQKDSNDKPISLTPRYLLVPTALEVLAGQLFSERSVNETTTANKPKVNSNPHAGNYEPLVSPYLSNTAIDENASSTAFYLLGDPADISVIDIAYLRGRRTPTIERGETSFNTLGMSWRGYFDFGVAFKEHRAGVKSDGQ